jgi:hypothetical protein
MARVPFTLRIDSEERAALESLSKIEGRPVNQLLNEAVKTYLSRRGPKELSLEATLGRLRAYRNRDSGFKGAIAAFVEAEATLDDPLEGELVEGQFRDGQFMQSGPAQSRIRELLQRFQG